MDTPNTSSIEIVDNRTVSVAEFAGLLRRSGLAERRPVNDLERLSRMLSHANLTLTAWDGTLLVGISRCVTDFAYCCYCSDLAVDKAYQGQGIGKALLLQTRERIHPSATLYLRSAPGAVTFYEREGPRIGLEPADRFFAMPPRIKA